MRLTRHIAIVLCITPLMMGASVYRWVDENGVVNYTQLKPEGVDAVLVSADTGRRIDDPRPAVTDASRSDGDAPLTEKQEQMLSDLKAAERARQEEIARVREANCDEARNVLQRLTSRGRIRVVGDDGVERVMPDEERQSRIDDAQRAVASNCVDTASR
ncbi:MAG: DUF4124 domain-containing protein [Pseudomonadales bacterium]